MERVAREIHILKLIRHPNIVQLYEIIETQKNCYLIMEYANGGELFDYIVANTRVKEPEACSFFQQIIAGVEYIHQLGVVHRDLKPENLLLDEKKNIKIVDFGLSNTYSQGQLLKTACGSPCYAAPEMIAGKRYVGSNVDIWSCGVILYALICGFLPFEDPNTAKLYKKILGGEFAVPKYISLDARDLLHRVLNTDPEQRYNVDEIRQHKWFNLHQPVCLNKGLIVAKNEIPIDRPVQRMLEQFGFDELYTLRCLNANKHNQVTTTYYLLLKQFQENGTVNIKLPARSKSIQDKVRPPSSERAPRPLEDQKNARQESSEAAADAKATSLQPKRETENENETSAAPKFLNVCQVKTSSEEEETVMVGHEANHYHQSRPRSQPARQQIKDSGQSKTVTMDVSTYNNANTGVDTSTIQTEK